MHPYKQLTRWIQRTQWYSDRRFDKRRRAKMEAAIQEHAVPLIEQIRNMAAAVAQAAPPPSEGRVLMMNLTSSPGAISFTQLSGIVIGWALQMQGCEVRHWRCRRGMLRCAQGVNRLHPNLLPFCDLCESTRTGMLNAWVTEDVSPSRETHALARTLRGLDLDGLRAYTSPDGLPLGELCLPSVRHALKRHNIPQIPVNLKIYRDFIASAHAVAREADRAFSSDACRALVAFNGYTFPEATARAVAVRHNLPVTTYEIGFTDESVVLSHGLAPDCEIVMPPGYSLSANEDRELDDYLSARFSGQSKMGGYAFWQDVEHEHAGFEEKASRFRHVVSIFTNTVYDTSQITANVAFKDMFEWLDYTLSLAAQHAATLFVVRVHPAEYMAGKKKSMETVEEWFQNSRFRKNPNIVLISPTSSFSSYALIEQSSVVIAYNSTIALEAAIKGKPIILGGRSKFSNEVFAPIWHEKHLYGDAIREYIGGHACSLPQEGVAHARRVFHYLLFKQSLSLRPFVGRRDLAVCLNQFAPEALLPTNSPVMSCLTRGILKSAPFVQE